MAETVSAHPYVQCECNDRCVPWRHCVICKMPKHYQPHLSNYTSYDGNTAAKEVKMKKPDFNRVWDRICEELEERPIVILGVVSTAIYGASQIMDSNTRRANAKTERKRTKIYDKEVERRIRQQQKQK